MASASLCLACRGAVAVAPSRVQRRGVVRVQAFVKSDFAPTHVSDSASVAEINARIGANIKAAAAHVGTMRVAQVNAAVGRFVGAAAKDAAAGKLKKPQPKKPKAPAASKAVKA